MIFSIKKMTQASGVPAPLLLVGAKGFEPSTSRSRTVRSTGLSHAPLLSLLGEASRIIHAAWAFGNPGAHANHASGTSP